MKKGILVITVLMLTFVMIFATGCGSGKTQEPVKASDGGTLTMKIGHVLAPTHPYQQGLEKFSELVAQKTGGKVKIDAFHSSQLGNEREMIEGLQMGTLDMALVSTAPLAGFSKEFLVFDLPFIFQSREQAYKVLDGEIGSEILGTLENQSIIGLNYWENGFRNVTNSKKPIIHPEDMKGMKIRTMENKIHMASFKTVGADPTPMAFGELFTALQQKTVDSQENPLPIIYTSNFFEVQKYLSMTGHFYAAAPLLISKAKWDALPKDVQQAIQEAAVEARDFERGLIKKADADLADTLKQKGMEISEVDKNEWLKAMEPVYKQYEGEIGAETINKVRSVK